MKDHLPLIIYPPREATLLTHTCPFYRQVTYDASVEEDKKDKAIKEAKDDKNDKQSEENKKSKKHLKFPPKVQLCYGQSIGVCELTHVEML